MNTNKIELLYNNIKFIKTYLVKISCCDTSDIIVPTNDIRDMLEDLLRLKTHELSNILTSARLRKDREEQVQ